MSAKATVEIEGLAVMQQGRYHQTPKTQSKESDDDYERRTWRDKAHKNEDGFVVIPPMAQKKCVEKAASMLSMKIVGRGKSTYTKHFLSGILVLEPAPINVRWDDMVGLWVFGDSKGERNKSGGKRVLKCFPTTPISDWRSTLIYYILDDTITEEVFSIHIREAGNFVGLGVFRPESGGYYGRFKVLSIVWEVLEEMI